MESQNIEYKKTWRDEYLKWICAFANTEGGKLYIGIDDNGAVCGVTARCFASEAYLALMNEHKETETDTNIDTVSPKMSDKEKSRMAVILDYLNANESISSSKAARLIDEEIKTANRLLVKAVELGILEAQGFNKMRAYSIKRHGIEK